MSLRASRFASWERAASSISSERRPITSPKIQISLSVYRPIISMSVACHKAVKRLSGVPLEMASFNSRSIDIGDPSCFPLLASRQIIRNCAKGFRRSGIGQSERDSELGLFLRNAKQQSGSVTRPSSAAAFGRLQRVVPTPSVMAGANHPALKLPCSRQNSATN